MAKVDHPEAFHFGHEGFQGTLYYRHEPGDPQIGAWITRGIVTSSDLKEALRNIQTPRSLRGKHIQLLDQTSEELADLFRVGGVVSFDGQVVERSLVGYQVPRRRPLLYFARALGLCALPLHQIQQFGITFGDTHHPDARFTFIAENMGHNLTPYLQGTGGRFKLEFSVRDEDTGQVTDERVVNTTGVERFMNGPLSVLIEARQRDLGFHSIFSPQSLVRATMAEVAKISKSA